MAYRCELRNTWGLRGRTNGNRGISFHPNVGFWVGPTRSGLINYSDYAIRVNDIEAAIAHATGHSNIDIISGFVGGNQSYLSYYYADGTMATSLSDSHVSPVTDVYAIAAGLYFTYHRSVGGLTQVRTTYTIELPADTRIRSSQDIANIITTATGYTVSPLHYAAPELTCADLDTIGGDTTVTIMPDILTPSSVTTTIVDGDPPYLAHVSATEPTNRGQGDMWFNPITGHLSVWTNGD